MNRELHSSITEGKQDEYMTENFVWEKTVVVRCKWKRCKWNMGANEVFFSKLSDFTQMDQGLSVRIILCLAPDIDQVHLFLSKLGFHFD